MTGNNDRELRVSSSRWLGVMFAGVVGTIPGFFAFAIALSHSGRTTDTMANGAWLFGSLVLAIVGLLGYARSQRRLQVGRERTPGRAAHR